MIVSIDFKNWFEMVYLIIELKVIIIMKIYRKAYL